jgi:hypothetical protein
MLTCSYDHIKERKEFLKAENNNQVPVYSEKCVRKELKIYRLEKHALFDPTLTY